MVSSRLALPESLAEQLLGPGGLVVLASAGIQRRRLAGGVRRAATARAPGGARRPRVVS